MDFYPRDISHSLSGASLYARKRMENKRDILENSARTKALLARVSKDEADADVLFSEAELLRNSAKELESQIEAIDFRIQDAKDRIDSARSVDELNSL